jgi:hypothetical protein
MQQIQSWNIYFANSGSYRSSYYDYLIADQHFKK